MIQVRRKAQCVLQAALTRFQSVPATHEAASSALVQGSERIMAQALSSSSAAASAGLGLGPSEPQQQHKGRRKKAATGEALGKVGREGGGGEGGAGAGGGGSTKDNTKVASASAVLHLLVTLRTLLPLLSSAALSRMLLRLTELLQIDHPLVSMHVLEALRGAAGPTSGAQLAPAVAPAVLADVITCLVRQEATWQEQRSEQRSKADAAAHSLLLLQVT